MGATATMASVMLSPRLMLIPTTMVDMVLDMDMASAMEGTMVDMVDMVLATATMASVMLSPWLMLIPTTMVDMASAMEGTMVGMVDMALAIATMASVMLSPRLMPIPTTMVDMVLAMDMALAMEGLTMVDMVDMDFIAIMAKLYLISSTCCINPKMLPTLLIINRKS